MNNLQKVRDMNGRIRRSLGAYLFLHITGSISAGTNAGRIIRVRCKGGRFQGLALGSGKWINFNPSIDWISIADKY